MNTHFSTTVWDCSGWLLQVRLRQRSWRVGCPTLLLSHRLLSALFSEIVLSLILWLQQAFVFYESKLLCLFSWILKSLYISITFSFLEPNWHFTFNIYSEVRDGFIGRRCIPNIEIPLHWMLCLVCHNQGAWPLPEVCKLNGQHWCRSDVRCT